jgi:hypothetical protein
MAATSSSIVCGMKKMNVKRPITSWRIQFGLGLSIIGRIGLTGSSLNGERAERTPQRGVPTSVW